MPCNPPTPSNNHHRDFYIFWYRSLLTFTCHGSQKYDSLMDLMALVMYLRLWTNTTSLNTNRLYFGIHCKRMVPALFLRVYFLNDGSAHLKMWLGKQERKHLFPRFFIKNLLCRLCWNIHDIPHSKWVDNIPGDVLSCRGRFCWLGGICHNHREIHPLWPPIAESEGINPTETTSSAQTRRFF